MPRVNRRYQVHTTVIVREKTANGLIVEYGNGQRGFISHLRAANWNWKDRGPADPPLEKGALYEDANGDFWRRGQDRWVAANNYPIPSSVSRGVTPTYPLRKLERVGKKVLS